MISYEIAPYISCVAANPGCRRAGKPACTVENPALPVHPIGDAAASQRIERSAGEVPLCEVFIPFRGPKAHADSQDWLPNNGIWIIFNSLGAEVSQP